MYNELYLVSGHYAEVCDGIVVSLNQPSLEGEVALATPTLVEVSRASTNREGQGFMPNWRTLVLVGVEHPRKHKIHRVEG